MSIVGEAVLVSLKVSTKGKRSCTALSFVTLQISSLLGINNGMLFPASWYRRNIL
jgi:hypothetical protein